MPTRLNATIVIEAPLLTKSSAPGDPGLDAVMAKNIQNEALLHDRHIKGRLREAWRELAAELDIPVDRWLGIAGGTRQNPAGSFVPNTGMIQFKDFRGPIVNEADPRVRVQIDPARRAAKEHMLQMMESPFASGQQLTFRGLVELEDGVDAELAKRAIMAGLYWSGTCGGMRTSGFGRILSVNLAVANTTDEAMLVDSGNDRIWVWLTTTDPICVTETRALDNLYVSGQTLPGSVIKGAVASSWLRSLGKGGIVSADSDPQKTQLSSHFEKIRFSHGRLVREEQGWSPALIPPLSIGRTETGFHDYALSGDIHAEGTEAVTFAPDWKDGDYETLGRRFGHEPIATELRVRTAIDSLKRRAAESQLFAWQVLVPQNGQGWLACIDFGTVPESDRSAAREQLLSLLSADIRYLGKTKASFRAQFLANPPAPRLPSQEHKAVYVLTLQAPALLGNPELLTEAHDHDALRHAYADDFSVISNGSLRLARFFARQYLQGGIYLYKRFLEGSAFPYQPYLLTAPGSVFVLHPVPDRSSEASDCIQEWTRYGLPAAPWSIARFARGPFPGSHWMNHPYLRENGFAEIAVNLACHWEDPVEIPNEEGEPR